MTKIKLLNDYVGLKNTNSKISELLKAGEVIEVENPEILKKAGVKFEIITDKK